MQNSVLTLMLAADFAAQIHKNHRRKGRSRYPFVCHSIRVARLLAESGADATVIAAGILHDCIELCDATEGGVIVDELFRLFDRDIVELVVEVTDDMNLEKEARKLVQLQRAPSLSDRGRLLKIADKCANLDDSAIDPPSDWSLDRHIAYFHHARAVVDHCRGHSASHRFLEARFDEAFAIGLALLQAQE